MNQAAGSALIRVLVVDDSPAARELIAYLLNSDPHLSVIGVAADGEQAVVMAQRLQPDVITMDIHLPKLDGFGATRKIMETCPTRIVMVTASSIPHEVAESFSALESGALTVIAKPPGPDHADYQAAAAELIQTIKSMAEVKVVKRWARSPAVKFAAPAVSAVPRPDMHATADIQLVAIGASTGGPLVLRAILSRLPPGFAVPILIVQHIAPGFSVGFVEWLSKTTGYPVCMPKHGEYALPGMAYFAPDGMQMRVLADGTIELVPDPPENGLRPSVSYLFRSVAIGFGSHAVGILLTGMGRDGANELKLMQDAGAVTIAQDKESAVVYGMPGEAVKLDAATYVLTPESIAETLNLLVKKRDN